VATNLGTIEFPASVSPVHFIKLDCSDAKEKLLSSNFYWRSLPEHPDDFTDLAKLPTVTLDAKVASSDADGKRTLTVTLHNPSKSIALMAHMQLRGRSPASACSRSSTATTMCRSSPERDAHHHHG
jgi:hypothetical protein